MQVTHIKVENYKSLKDISATGFSEMNFIFGFNNSGKSNFLKFIELIFSGKSIMGPEEYLDENGRTKSRMKVIENTPFWRGYIYDSPYIFCNNLRTNNIVFEIQLVLKNTEFPHSEELIKGKYLYSDRESTPILIKGEIKSIDPNTAELLLKEVQIKGTVIYTNTDGFGKYFEGSINPNLLDNEEFFNEVMYYFNNCVMLIESERYFGKEILSNEPPEIFSTSNFKNWLYGISLDAEKFEMFSSLIDFLNNFSISSKVGNALEKNLYSYPFKNTKIDFSKFKDEIEIMLINPIGRFPLKNYGTGIQQLLYILSRLFGNRAKIILIEELELNLSPEYQELIINNLKSFIKDGQIDQVFFTSHSDYLHRNDFKVYEVSIDITGKSDIKSSTYSQLNAMRRNLLTYAESGD